MQRCRQVPPVLLRRRRSRAHRRHGHRFPFFPAGAIARLNGHAIEQTGRRAVAIRADSADPQAVHASVAQAVEALGGPDILVNNAGIARYESVADVSLATLDEILNMHVRSVALATQAALPHRSSLLENA